MNDAAGTTLEVFMSGGQWTLRDLDSRNGTMVGSQIVHGDWQLKPGDTVRIGHTQLVFVHKLSDAFTSSGDGSSVVRRLSPDAPQAAGEAAEDEAERAGGARAHDDHPSPGQDEVSGPRRRRGRAAFRRSAERRRSFAGWPSSWPRRPTWRRWPSWPWSGLAEGTQTDAGALLLLSASAQGPPRGEDLEVVASRSSTEHRYHRVSNFLASTVMREGEAVLARNVSTTARLGTRDSQGEILATSVICARSATAARCSD